MKQADKVVAAHAASQHGVVTRAQVLAAGLTARQLDLRLAGGGLVAVHRGVYRVGGAPSTVEQAVMAACLAARGVASRRSAAALWRLRGCEAGPVEVTVRGRRRPDLAGVAAHTTSRLDAVDVTERLGIPVTSPARTLVDLGACVAREAVEAALEDALFRGLVNVPLLVRTLGRLCRPGRDGAGVLRQLLEERDPTSAPTESELETAAARLLNRAGLPDPVRQHLVHAPGRRSLRIDLAYPEALLGIEVDSRIWHSGRVEFQGDRTRGNLLTHLGWRILRFTADDVRRRPSYVVRAVARELASPAAASAG